ncbi:hypothetical protein [Flavobacterium succinicans]|uniref:Uncharacterized protein n=1 Tax=Flavobacterium succinicans TaxID=29536 RepID=A0A199XU77_9FLAO|nr:hypothetical protein [Flavobacterium succinicans]OAZ05318.1 hypothetical protein FLB_02780 [Flavobacterium succinicans]
MEKLINNCKNNLIAGVLFLLPLYVLMIIVQKTFGFFAKFGNGMAKFLGLDTILGKNMANVFGVLFLFSFLIICGFLVRLSFFKRISDSIDEKLKIYLPGYEKHKEMAKQKLINEDKNEETPIIPEKIPVLFQFNGSWIPAFLKEKNDNGEVIVYFSNANAISETGFCLTSIENIRILDAVTEAEFIKSIDANGEGFLELIKNK